MPAKLSLIFSPCLLTAVLTALLTASLTAACTSPSASQKTTPTALADVSATDVTLANRPKSDQTQSDQTGKTSQITAAEKNSDTANDTAESSERPLQSVPPNGIDSLTEEELSYFQQMGPLEYAARLGGLPQQQAWRTRLRLYPNEAASPDGQTYLVKLDHYNLSPALYRDLLPSYGENVDPSLNEESPHQNFQFTFFPVMGIAADLLSEATVTSQSSMAENPACGIDLACAELRTAPEIDPLSATNLSLGLAPWEDEVEPVYSLVRALAEQAGWRQAGTSSSWNYREVPEGLSSVRASADEADRVWVEILIDNYSGNGDGYSAEWIEYVADDSVRQVVHQIVYSDRANAGQAATKYVCARGEAAGELRESCP